MSTVKLSPETQNALALIAEFGLAGGPAIKVSKAAGKSATSAIDNETEHLIQIALNEISKNRTTIVIAHRLSTIKNANKILVLGDMNITEQGTHEQLIEKNGIYKQLWDIQSGNN